MAIAKAEREYLLAGIHLLSKDSPQHKEVDRQRQLRHFELQELLMGPLTLGLEQLGWGERWVNAHVIRLENAASFATHWERPNDRKGDKNIEEASLGEFLSDLMNVSTNQSKTQDACPQKRLDALLENLAVALLAVMKMGGQDGGSLGKRTNAAHSRDFRSVEWFGTKYTFTAKQAGCVARLWEAWKSGMPDISQAAIQTDLDVSALRGLFRKHPAWGKMIVPGEKKGTFRLQEPEE
jgi:hypothetical protein